jgi:hypothetical protein
VRVFTLEHSALSTGSIETIFQFGSSRTALSRRGLDPKRCRRTRTGILALLFGYVPKQGYRNNNKTLFGENLDLRGNFYAWKLGKLLNFSSIGDGVSMKKAPDLSA